MDPITIILAILMWLGGAAMTGRRTYTLKQKEWLAVSDSEEARAARMSEIKNQLKSMRHDICNLNYTSMRSMGCDCGKQSKWMGLHEELDSLQEGGPVGQPPAAPYYTLVTWPITAFHNFITPEVKPEPAVAEVVAPDENVLQQGAVKDWVDPWGHLRADDKLGMEIKQTWADIKGQYEADLEHMMMTGQSVHGVEYGEKYVIMDDNGKVVKTYKFDPEPVLIGAGGGAKSDTPLGGGGGPKVPKKGRRTTSTGPY